LRDFESIEFSVAYVCVYIWFPLQRDLLQQSEIRINPIVVRVRKRVPYSSKSGREKLWQIIDFKVLMTETGKCLTPVLLAGEKLWRI